MGTLVGTTASRQPGPTGPGDPKGNPRQCQNLKKGKRRILAIKMPERPTGKNRTSRHGTDDQCRPWLHRGSRQTCNMKKKRKPHIVENITRESAGDEFTPARAREAQKEFERCVSEQTGRAPRCTGDVRIIEVVASEARERLVSLKW